MGITAGIADPETEPMRRQTMAANYFSEIEPVRYAGPETNDPLAYRYYDAKRVVLG